VSARPSHRRSEDAFRHAQASSSSAPEPREVAAQQLQGRPFEAVPFEREPSAPSQPQAPPSLRFVFISAPEVTLRDTPSAEIDVPPPPMNSNKKPLFCALFLKTGACRFGASCARFHLRPPLSSAIVARGLYNGPVDGDVGVSARGWQTAAGEFLRDVRGEFLRFGRVVVCQVEGLSARR
jgi:hypothetical protein